MNTKKGITFLLIGIFVLLAIIGSMAFAYFTSGKTVASKLNTTVVKGNTLADETYTFRATKNEVLMTVNNTELTGSVGEIKNKTVTLTSSLLSTSTTKYECTYDIYYKWEDDTDAYTITGANEFTYSLDGGSQVNFVASSNKTPQKINSTSFTINNNSVDTPTNINHTITTKFYKISGNQTSNGGKVFNVKFYIDNVNCVGSVILVQLLNNKVLSSDQVPAGENGSLQKQDVTVTQNATLGINSSSYTNIIYTGANPNNFIEFNGEKWRIIGVYNEDSHGIANTKLVKIIRNNSLGKFMWDYKYTSVGSARTNYGSNEWSDSQLMFMLNGQDALNKGKIYNSNTYTYANTRVNGNYIQTRINTGTYYDIWNKSNGSYLSYGSNGNSYTNKTLYKPSKAQTSGLTDATATIDKTLSQNAQSLIQEVTWHLGGLSSSENTVNIYYSYERGASVYNGSSASTTSTQRSTTWTGKIGLIYPSDYAYATSGGSTTRNTCLGYNLNSWDSYSDCYKNDWLYYAGVTSSQGYSLAQWTITPLSSSAQGVFNITTSTYYNGYIYSNAASSNTFAVRPSLYLKADTMVFTSGDGSYTNPYVIAQ